MHLPLRTQVSFFASSGEGGNFDGLVWVDGVAAVSRPGFIVSTTSLTVPYDGHVSFTIRPDTMPTESVLVTVTSSQPSKAAATADTRTFVLGAGRQDTFTITIQSWCSSSPGNCARAGATVIGFEASALPGSASSSGNYHGVVSARTITAYVEPPGLVLTHAHSPGALLVQTELGAGTFQLLPSQPVDVDMIVSVRVLDTSVCSVPSVLAIPAGTYTNGAAASAGRPAVVVPVTFVGVGETQAEFLVESPGDSKFLNIDPEVLTIRSLTGFAVSPQNISLQPQTSVTVSIAPLIVPGADVTCRIEVSDPAVISVSPEILVFSPPRVIVGKDVAVSVGQRVVLAEAFQVVPRLGDGTITQTLNDNLDSVVVVWDTGAQQQTVSTGAGGMFMLALAEPLPEHAVVVTHKSAGPATLGIRASSDDFVFNGAHLVHASRVSAEPGLVLSPATATMQYKQSSDFDVRPQSAPTSDVSVAISVAATNPPSGTILPLGHVCKHLHTRTCAGGY